MSIDNQKVISAALIISKFRHRVKTNDKGNPTTKAMQFGKINMKNIHLSFSHEKAVDGIN